MNCHKCNRRLKEGGIDIGYGLVVCQDCAENDPVTKQVIESAEAAGNPSSRGS